MPGLQANLKYSKQFLIYTKIFDDLAQMDLYFTSKINCAWAQESTYT